MRHPVQTGYFASPRRPRKAPLAAEADVPRQPFMSDLYLVSLMPAVKCTGTGTAQYKRDSRYYCVLGMTSCRRAQFR